MSGFLGKVFGAFTSRKPSFDAKPQNIKIEDNDDGNGAGNNADSDKMPVHGAATASRNPMKRLFEEEDDDEGAGGFGKASSFTINEEFANRYEHNKKREEKQKLEEKYGKAEDYDDDSDSSSDDGTEDEDAYLLTEDLDARMSAALQAIKNKDPRLYDTDAKFFDAAEAEKAGREAAAAAAKDPKQKPIYLQDYHRERYMRGDIGADDDDNDDNEGAAAPPKTYQQEQDAIKKELIDSMNAADDEEGGAKIGHSNDDGDSDIDAFIKPKASTKAAKEAAAANGVHPSRSSRIQVTKLDVESADKDPALFLSNFLASRSWAAEDETEGGPGWKAFGSDDEDEEGQEGAEAFETAFNLRFEDPNKSNEVLKSYSRTVVSERSVRREEKTARQRARDQERAQKEAAKLARREERARLRKLNIEEAQEKLAKIKQAAGVAGRDLAEDEWMGLLDDAWDNNAWEKEMQKHFGDDYYAEKDVGLEDELAAEEDGGPEEDGGSSKKGKKKAPKKPKWDDDIDIKDLIPDFDDDEAPKISLTDDEEGGDDEEEEDNDDEENDGHEAKRRKTGKDHKKERAEAKRDARRERARIEALVDRKMELDDPTAMATGVAGPSNEMAGFRYRETSPQAFGLTARDILLAPSDSALNEFAGLKKLATFRDEERKRKDRKKLGKKARLRQWRRDTFGADFELTGPTFGFEKFVDEEAEAAAAAAAAAAGGHSRKSSKHSKHSKHNKHSKSSKDSKDKGGDADKPKKRKRSRKNKGKGEEVE
ncbi:Kinetochore protein Spc24 [Sporothrix curviconia]|uniref:Kinetochore protein Spc24 n=1 Tax=Sporothrix curviconia TaxID=1260050 RepID=A0ABP0B8I1_9PEZI